MQLILTAIACVALWRYARKQSPIVAAGFLIRAFAGQVLFWISWLKLPIARSLQLGNGFWFFAIDGPWYLGYANELIPRGPLAILTVNGTYPSYTFVQAFTIFCAAFGAVASTAILFNCAAYLATCALIERIGDGRKTFTLAVIAFGPAMILWSLQALKDTFFFLLIVALIYALQRWQEAPRNWLPCAAALVMLVYLIAGTRWYLAGIAWGLSAIFFVMSSISTRRWWPALLLFLLLGQAFRFGGGTELPTPVRNVLAGRRPVPVAVAPVVAPVAAPVVAPVAAPVVTPVAAPVAAPVAPPVVTPMVALAKEVKYYATAPRKGFESTGGATAIHAGPAAPSPIASGAVATFVPRAAAQPLNLVRIGGGRGFWFFADFDTVVFSAVFVFAIVLCVKALRGGARITPLFVFAVLLFFATAGPMFYSVTNFGTLFRLRSMLYVLAAIAPLTLRRTPEPAPVEWQ